MKSGRNILFAGAALAALALAGVALCAETEKSGDPASSALAMTLAGGYDAALDAVPPGAPDGLLTEGDALFLLRQAAGLGGGEPSRWRPTPGLSWEIRYTGATTLAALAALDVAVLNLDLFDTEAATIAALQAGGKRVVCYFSAGSWEDWRPDAGDFPAAVKGKPLDGWPGEKWLDVRSPAVLALHAARLDLARSKGCDAVDPDNVDVWAQDSGFPVTKAQNLAFLRALAEAAHARGLAAGLKNDLEQVADLVDTMDFAVNEECWQYDECATLDPFVARGKPVWGIEYKGAASSFCPKANARNFDFLKKKLDLGDYREACR